MMILYPPNRLEYPPGVSVFLAGSIEMGIAKDWQTDILNSSSQNDYPSTTFFNPRRVEWDNSWVQSIDNPKFKEQVTWELDHIDLASIVFFYFDPDTKSPISLMELGYCIQSKETLIVCCPDGFYRKGNVDIMCNRRGVSVHTTLDSAINDLKSKISQYDSVSSL